MSPVSFHGAESSPGGLLMRLESLLALWRHEPYWLSDAATTRPEQTGRPLGPDLISALSSAEVVPPRTHVSGMKRLARTHGTTLEELEGRQALRVRGERVAVNSAKLRAEVPDFRGHGWSIRLPAPSPELADSASTVFHGLTTTPDGVFLSEPKRPLTECLPSLLREAIDPSCSDEIATAWTRALALDIDGHFVGVLPSLSRDTLSTTLGQLLKNASPFLTLFDDVHLDFFSEGRQAPDNDVMLHRSSWLPRSIFTDLCDVAIYAQHSHRPVSTDYYEDLARGFARIADLDKVSQLVATLPPGRTLATVLETLERYRPELLARMLRVPSAQGAALFGLTTLRQQRQTNAHALDLTEQWLQVQRLVRSLVAADGAMDFASFLALGVSDEADALSPPSLVSARLRRVDTNARLESWRTLLSSAPTPEEAVALLENYLATRPWRGDAGLVFTMRCVQLMSVSKSLSALLPRVATSLVDAYAHSLEVIPVMHSAPDLRRHGSLLRVLYSVLQGDPSLADARARFLRPFDIETYLALAVAEQGKIHAPSPLFDVPKAFHAHVQTLLTLALSIEDREEVLDAALEYYLADRRPGRVVNAFSWNAAPELTSMLKPDGEAPLFVQMGRALAGSPRREMLLRTILRERPEAHVLGDLIRGLKKCPDLISPLRAHAVDLIAEVLASPDGVALGEALELANISLQAGLGREAERCARLVIEIVDKQGSNAPLHHLQGYRDTGSALLAGSLAAQGQWAELDSLQLRIVSEIQALAFKNMKAVAAMELGKLAEAGHMFDEILGRSPADRVALINHVAFWVRKQDWPRVIAAAERALSEIPSDDHDMVLRSEILARQKLGDKWAAETALKRMSEDGRLELLRQQDESPAAAWIQDAAEIQAAVVADTRLPDGSGSLSAHEDQTEQADVAILTIIPEEYEAVCAALPGLEKAPERPLLPNIYGWMVGKIAKTDSAAPLRVAVALAGEAGNLPASHAATRTIDRWRPRYLVLSGIAGGLPKDGLRQGDLVLAKEIWHYDHGKVTRDRFFPRLKGVTPSHSDAVNSAHIYGAQSTDWKTFSVAPPRDGHVPGLLSGLVASGDKVVDDLRNPMIADVLKVTSELYAIEMEGAGVASAVEKARAEGRSVSFMMVRGISDMPLSQDAIESDSADGKGKAVGQTAERDKWKRYAAALSASFVAGWIRSKWGPAPK